MSGQGACWPCSGDSPWNCGVPGVLRYGRIRLRRHGRDGLVPAFEEEIAPCPGCKRCPDAGAARAAFERAEKEKGGKV